MNFRNQPHIQARLKSFVTQIWRASVCVLMDACLSSGANTFPHQCDRSIHTRLAFRSTLQSALSSCLHLLLFRKSEWQSEDSNSATIVTLASASALYSAVCLLSESSGVSAFPKASKSFNYFYESQWLMIIIPIKWLFHWEIYPIFRQTLMNLCTSLHTRTVLCTEACRSLIPPCVPDWAAALPLDPLD